MKKSTLFISAAATVMVIGMATGIYCYYQARNSIYGTWHPAQDKSGQDIFSGNINIIKINPMKKTKTAVLPLFMIRKSILCLASRLR